MSNTWRRTDHPDLATHRILDAAGKVFGELGVSAAGMNEIAEASGCSRGTLYRYFESRHALHVAYVQREARRIAARLREATHGVRGARERIVRSIEIAVREVRSQPGTAAWFAPAASGLGARMSRSPEVARTLGEAFGSELLGGVRNSLLSRWVVRVIVSLLQDPAEGPAEEHALLERFVAPALTRGGEARR